MSAHSPTNGIDVVLPTLTAGNLTAPGSNYRHRRRQLLALLHSPYVQGTTDTAFDGTVALAILSGPTGGVFEGNTSGPASSGS